MSAIYPARRRPKTTPQHRSSSMVNRYRPRNSDSLHNSKMPPLLFYLPFIVWTGVIQVLMDATFEFDEPNTIRRVSAGTPPASIIHLPTRLALL